MPLPRWLARRRPPAPTPSGEAPRRPEPHLLSAQQVAARLPDLANGLILLDIRRPDEWHGEGRIAGATWIPLEELGARAAAELPPDAEIIVYCAHGVRSAYASRALLRAGWPVVGDLAGGFYAWVSAGLPVEHGRLQPPAPGGI